VLVEELLLEETTRIEEWMPTCLTIRAGARPEVGDILWFDVFKSLLTRAIE